MLTDFLEKNDVKSLNQPITSTQISSLQSSLAQDIDEKRQSIHQLYLDKTREINKVDTQSIKLIDECEQLQAKRKELSAEIEECSKLEIQARNLNSNYHQVHRLDRFIAGLKRLIDLQNVIQDCRQLCKKGDLNEAKAMFQSIDSIIHDPYLFPSTNEKSYQKHHSLYEAFQRSIRQLRSDIAQSHLTLWNDAVERIETNQVKLACNQLDKLFQCIFDEHKGERTQIETNIRTFANFCLQSFFKILLEQPMKVLIEREEEEESNAVSIRIVKDEEANSEQIQQFNEALNQLRSLFDVLNDRLLSRMMNVQSSKIKLMTIFSSAIVNELIELIREHLLNLIPSDAQHLDNFRSLLRTVADLEQYLVRIDFFPEKKFTNVLTSVIGNIDEAIVKSRCRVYLLQARQLLMSQATITTTLLTIEIGDDEEAFKQNEQEKERYKTETMSNILSTTISLDELDANMFRFPCSIVAEHVHQYMQLVRTILREADQLEQYGAHLCATARNLIELFNVIYGSLHEIKAQEFPYLTALHFNTYMYVAHQCLLLGEEFYHLKTKTGDGQPISFVDYVPVFRNQAATLLKHQLDGQLRTLTKFIKDIGGFHNIGDDDERSENRDVLKRAVNQCTIHIENLSRAWRNVFSPHVYFRVTGYLCDQISLLLINETLSLEDIPEQECQIMVNAFTQWSTFLQTLLVKDDQSPGLNILARLAPNLTRFNELCLLLNSSLQTIVDRWFNGQGPLASHFTVPEVKQLIRALFQTSERRTAALAKIQ